MIFTVVRPSRLSFSLIGRGLFGAIVAVCGPKLVFSIFERLSKASGVPRLKQGNKLSEQRILVPCGDGLTPDTFAESPLARPSDPLPLHL